MYIVKLTIKPSNPKNSRERYRKTYYEGVYLPKENSKKVRHEKIKQGVEQDIIANLKKRNPALQIDYTIKIEHNAMDFVVKEDEPTTIIENGKQVKDE